MELNSMLATATVFYISGLRSTEASAHAITINEANTLEVVDEVILKANFDDHAHIPLTEEKLTIESVIDNSETTSLTNINTINMVVIYDRYSESWTLTNHTNTTLCVSQISSLIIVAQNLSLIHI